MIRTAILAGILLVMLSLAYSRPGAVPLLAARAPVVEEAEVVQDESIAEPVARRAPPRVAKSEDPKIAEPEQLSLPLEEQVAETAPAAPVLPPRPVAPPAPAAEPGRPISLLPQTANAVPLREPKQIAPLISDDMPAAPAPMLPAVQEATVPAALPEVYVPTRPVNAPQDLASRMTPDGKVAPAVVADARAPMVAAAGTKFMTPQERSRELYKLAREMEDTFIQNMTK